MRRPLTLYLLGFIFLSAVLGASAVTTSDPTFTTIDFPGAISTVALDINPAGDIVGSYNDAGGTHGYLLDKERKFSAIDFPGAVFTRAAGINRYREVVGTYRLPTDPMAFRHGFVLAAGRFATIDPPGAVFTNPLGINRWGLIVGRYCTTVPCQGANVHGFLLNDGEFRKIDIPGASGTNAWKINVRGDIVGGYTGADGSKHVFRLRSRERTFTTIDVPGGAETALDNGGINSDGDIVAVYCDTAPCGGASRDAHGFLLNRGRFSRIDFPGAIVTNAFAINARGDIVGVYEDARGPHGFLLRGSR